MPPRTAENLRSLGGSWFPKSVPEIGSRNRVAKSAPQSGSLSLRTEWGSLPKLQRTGSWSQVDPGRAHWAGFMLRALKGVCRREATFSAVVLRRHRRRELGKARLRSG
jgi:hypothetical protein